MALCTTASGAGALTQMIATGALDSYLTSGATFTFWKTRYNKYSMFALESISQPFNTAVSFGAEAQMTLNRNGDMLFYMYVVIDLPGISCCPAVDSCGTFSQFPACGNACAPCAKNDKELFRDYAPNVYYDDGSSAGSVADEEVKAGKAMWEKATLGACKKSCLPEEEDCPMHVFGEHWCHWANDIGHVLIRRANIVIGGSTIDSLYSVLLFCWEELSGRSGRRLTEMTGKRYTRVQLALDSQERRLLHVPLPFWFTQHSGQALALASLQFHSVQLYVEFEKLERCIVVSSPGLMVKNCSTACCITPADLSAVVESTYVFLDVAERDRFATTHYETLIVQHQGMEVQVCNNQVRMPLTMNHPVIELIWVIRRDCNIRCNNAFNFAGIDGRDPLVSASLMLNNQARFSCKPATYFRLVQPYQQHSNNPDIFK